MKRGFICILFKCEETTHGVYRKTTMETWKACLNIAVKTFRFNNPGSRLYIFDIHDQLQTREKEIMQQYAMVRGSGELKEAGFVSDTFNKIIALDHIGFDETCLFDLDFVFTGPMDNIFQLVDDDLGVLDYPNYLRTENRINSGIIVLRNRSVLEVLHRQRHCLDKSLSDEDLIDRSVSEKKLTITRLPDIYGKSKQMWWARSAKDLTPSCASKWVGPLSIDWSRQPPIFSLGEQRVFAWHFSSAKERMAADPIIASYMKRIDQWFNQKTRG
jgi:hypothetical protein